MFGSVGQVTHLSIKYDQLSGRSQGFASVYFLHEHDADAAIAKYNGLSLDGINMELKRGKTRFGMLDRVGDKMRIEKPASKSIADRLGEPVASSSNSSDILARLGSKTTGILSRLDGTPKPQREKKIIQKHPENKDSRSLLSYGEVADEQVMGDL